MPLVVHKQFTKCSRCGVGLKGYDRSLNSASGTRFLLVDFGLRLN